jgi:stearoyl-CoA desaturase (Delta-9 desaturase)
MWFNGLLDLAWWQIILAILLLTHITIVSVTVYLHRHSAHRALDLHPILSHFFRFWLWLTTGMGTKDWTAIHRKHHAKCETDEDPHSPVTRGLSTVMWQGAELYRAGKTAETREKYGKGTPEDWIENNLYSRYEVLGISIMFVIDLLLFGVLGITVWAVQMIWIPFFAAGMINGLGHHSGYRNYECADAATNISPWGILIGGEELHNNHHTYPSSAKLSNKWWEFDIGWMYIRLFSMLGLAKVKRLPPTVHTLESKKEIDGDTVMAIITNRFQVMSRYSEQVIQPLLQQIKSNADNRQKSLYRKAKKLLNRNNALITRKEQQSLARLLEENAMLKTLYEKRMELQAIWQRRASSNEEIIQALHDWIHRAEESGIQMLGDFAQNLRHYTMGPQQQPA